MTELNEDAPLLEICGATVVKNGFRILDDLKLQIADGEHTAILGPNGSGKSSLLKLMTYQFHALAHEDRSPTVRMFGAATWDVFALRSLLGVVSADMHQSFVNDEEITAMEAVVSGFFASFGLFTNHAVTPEMLASAEAALAMMDATRLAEKPMARMSTGEVRRVLIARALAPDPRALLLDEPTTGLDVVSGHVFLETLRRVAHAGKTVLLITHHAREILPEIQRVILLKQGRVFMDGPKREVLTTRNLSALFGARVAVHRNGDYYSAEVEQAMP